MGNGGCGNGGGGRHGILLLYYGTAVATVFRCLENKLEVRWLKMVNWKTLLSLHDGSCVFGLQKTKGYLNSV